MMSTINIDTIYNNIDMSKSFSRGYGPLHEAASEGKEDVIQSLLEHGVDINTKTGTRETALQIAIEEGREEIVKILLARGANFDVPYYDDGAGPDPLLHIAVKRGYKNIAKLLLDHGVDVNITKGCAYYSSDDDPTSLHLACENGHEELVKLLLDYGANIYASRYIDHQFHLNHTMLHSAAKGGNENIFQLLLDRGINLDINAEADKEGSVLCVACREGHEKIVRILLDRGVDVKEDEGPYGHYFQECDDDVKNYIGLASVHAAARGGNENVFKLILDYVFNTNFPNTDAESASQPNMIRSYEEIIKILFVCGAKDGVQHQGNFNNDSTLLLSAAKGGNENIVKLLLECGMDVDVTDFLGGTALQQVSSRGYETLVKLLLEHGAKVNIQDKHGGTALQGASSRGYETLVKLLLKHGAKVNIQDKHGETALHIAVYRQNEKIVNLLLSHGADPNLDFLTLANAVFRERNEKIMKALITHGADINKRNDEGNTILEEAFKRGNRFSYVRLLLHYGADITNSILFAAIKPCPPITYEYLGLEENEKEIIELLLDYGANVQNKLNNSCTILSHAVKQRGKTAIQLLLDYQADINIEDNEKRSIVRQALDRRYKTCAKILTQHIVKIKSAGLHVTEKILQDIDSNDELRSFKIQCEEEIEKIKCADDEISIWKVLISNVPSLTNFARNKYIIEVLASEELKLKFPIYSSVMKNQIRRGIWRNILLDKVKFFFGAVAKAEGNESLPLLPRLCVEEIFSYFSNKDFRNLIKVCDPFNDFALDLCDIKI